MQKRMERTFVIMRGVLITRPEKTTTTQLKGPQTRKEF